MLSLGRQRVGRSSRGRRRPWRSAVPTPTTRTRSNPHLHPTPSTLHPTPYNPHPTPYTLHPTPYTATPYTLHDKNAKPSTCCLASGRKHPKKRNTPLSLHSCNSRVGRSSRRRRGPWRGAALKPTTRPPLPSSAKSCHISSWLSTSTNISRLSTSCCLSLSEPPPETKEGPMAQAYCRVPAALFCAGISG